MSFRFINFRSNGFLLGVQSIQSIASCKNTNRIYFRYIKPIVTLENNSNILSNSIMLYVEFEVVDDVISEYDNLVFNFDSNKRIIEFPSYEIRGIFEVKEVITR